MNSSALISTLSDLVAIPSVNPAYDGGVSEIAVCDYVSRFCASHGLESWTQEVFPGRPNLIARLPGQNPKRRIILEAHTDTAPIHGMSVSPFDPECRNGNLYGRGACDTKAGLAAMMHAVGWLKQYGITPPCEVWLAAVADEEFSFRGVLKLCEGLTANAALVAEPTELRLVTATKGVLRWQIRVCGKAAHSSKPHLGVNAIEHMARLILALEQDSKRGSTTVHPLLGPATCNIGVIRGGVQVNAVPDECVIEVDRRLLPGETIRTVLDHYQALLDELSTRHPGFRAEQKQPMLTDEALETPASADVVQVAQRVLSGMGWDGTPTGVPFGSDASKLARHGIPSVVVGPGSINRAHAAEEFVELDQVEAAFEFYRTFLQTFE
ncbi:MAG: M20 family metallopeptidase [Verrucomicrobia bacterium]|nr:M20 family metallopeptidase [Verrucomicrobiota bacterium]